MSKLKIITLNVNSIVSLARRHYLDQFLKEQKPDIALITETRLNFKYNVFFDNYKVIRSDRTHNKGGGCAILIKENLEYNISKITNLIHLELTGITVSDSIGNRKLHIFAIYNRIGNVDYTQDLNNILNVARNGDVIMGGDFNSRNPEWGDSKYNLSGKLLDSWLKDDGLKYDVSLVPTFHPTREQSYLDFFIISNSLNVEFNPRHPYFLQTIDYESDHKAVELVIADRLITKSKPIKIKDFSKTNIKEFQSIINREIAISTLDNHRNLSNEEITTAADKLISILQTAATSSVPEVTLKERGLIPISDLTVKLISFKKTLRRRLHRTGNPIFKSQLRDISKIIAEQILIQTTKFWESKFSSITMNKDTFKEIKKLAGIKRGVDISCLQLNQTFHDDEKDIVDILAQQFEKVHQQNSLMGTTEHNSLINNSIAELQNHKPLFQFTQQLNSSKTNSHDDNLLYKEFINTAGLDGIVKSRNNKKSAGNDTIPMYLLKKIPQSLKEQLVILFNNMYNNAFIPLSWKQAKICAILKPSKSPLSPSSYRPISLTPNVSKLYEVFLNEKIRSHIDEHNILQSNQFGFRRNLSTNHALTIFTTDVSNNLNKKYGTIAVGIDTEKAFDTAWQSGIVYKMKEQYKFPPHLCKVTLNYLKNRTFYVQQKETKSSVKNIAEGVPQGSILGPVLFNLFIADLPTPQNSTVKTLGYADDILVYATHPKLSIAQEHLNQYMKKYSDYTEKWKIKTNIAKCEAIKIANAKSYKNAKKLKLNIKLGNTEIQKVELMKYLGLNINTKFKFETHINNVIRKCKIALSLYFKILRMNNSLKSKIKFIFYKQMIRSIISYAFPAWFNVSSSSMEKLRVFERKCLTYCTGDSQKIENDFKKISNKKLYEKCELIRIDNFLVQLALKFYGKLNNIDNPLIKNIVEQEISLNSNNYSIKHISLLQENNLLYNENNEIIYYNGRFNHNQYVK